MPAQAGIHLFLIAPFQDFKMDPGLRRDDIGGMTSMPDDIGADDVREPLLSVLKISPEFRPAYDPLLRMGMALGSVDLAAGRALLIELQQLQPSRPEAAEALRNSSH